MLINPQTFHIKPDNDNFNMHLRGMRQFKNARAAVELVRDDMKDAIPEIKTFRIAMAACERAAAIPNIPQTIEHGTELVRIMVERLGSPDYGVLNMYMRLVAQRKAPGPAIKAILDVDEILTKHLNWKDVGSVVPKLEGDKRARFLELCDGIINSIKTLMEHGHITKGTAEEKAWKFRKRKYEQLRGRLGSKRVSVTADEKTYQTTAKLKLRPSASIHLRNVDRYLGRQRRRDDAIAELPSDA